MENTKKQVLANLLSDLESKTFEIEAWKQKATLLIKRIFGDNDPKLALIEELHYDFSSWSLRDSSGGKSNDKVKEAARGIIDAAIAEISLESGDNVVVEVLRYELSGKDFETLSSIMASDKNREALLQGFIASVSNEVKDLIIKKLIEKSM